MKEENYDNDKSSSTKRKVDDDENDNYDISESYTSRINLEDDDINGDVSKSYSTQNKLSNTKMRIKLNSNSNFKIGIFYS